MELKSLEYIAFFLLVVIVYYLFQRTNYQKYILLIADIVLIFKIAGKRSLLVIFFSRYVYMILSILVYTLFSRMFDLIQPPVVKHSIAVA